MLFDDGCLIIKTASHGTRARRNPQLTRKLLSVLRDSAPNGLLLPPRSKPTSDEATNSDKRRQKVVCQMGNENTQCFWRLAGLHTVES